MKNILIKSSKKCCKNVSENDLNLCKYGNHIFLLQVRVTLILKDQKNMTLNYVYMWNDPLSLYTVYLCANSATDTRPGQYFIACCKTHFQTW
jgi:hypothetical protein